MQDIESQLSSSDRKRIYHVHANDYLRIGPTPGGAVPDSATSSANSPITIIPVGRAATTFDTTRLNGPISGGFQPQGIPTPGTPYFDSPEQANVQGSGSAIAVNAATAVGTVPLKGTLQLATSNISGTGVNVVAQHAYVQSDRLAVGLTQTALADSVNSTPEVLDLAGPSAKVTAYSGGVGTGIGRLSLYYLTTQDSRPGLTAQISVEQPQPQILTNPNGAGGLPPSTVFSHIPDFINTVRCSGGDIDSSGKYHEVRHLQFGSVCRGLGILNNAVGSSDVSTFGWGLTLTGHTAVMYNADAAVNDAVYFSVTYGHGIANYINDLRSTNLAAFGYDAAPNAAGQLVALPVLAWYTGYTHNWNNAWRSSITYSHVGLDSYGLYGPTAYRDGEYAAVNLVRHVALAATVADPSYATQCIMGFEYLYGLHETFNGAWDDAQRLLFMVQYVH